MKNIFKGIDYVIFDAPMKEYTSFKAGGKADALFLPETEEELTEVISLLTKENIPFMVMGNGSDLLVRDGGFRGALVKVGKGFSAMDVVETNKLKVGSGALLSQVGQKALREELTGMEFACGIPGSIGGAIFMNAGAYGGEMKDIVTEVTVLSKDGQLKKTVGVEELELGYRKSIIQKSKQVVLDVTFQLEAGNKEDIAEKMGELMKRRNEKQPATYPSGGSFFKRPSGYFAGKLIEEAGLKGVSVGGAQVSTLHSGFIINTGGATATDIITLMHLIQEKVKAQSGVDLEPEVQIIGEDYV